MLQRTSSPFLALASGFETYPSGMPNTSPTRMRETVERDRWIERAGRGKIMKFEVQPGLRDDYMKQNKAGH